MPEYKVKVIHKQTGKVEVVIADAESESQAVKGFADEGFSVQSIKEIYDTAKREKKEAKKRAKRDEIKSWRWHEPFAILTCWTLAFLSIFANQSVGGITLFCFFILSSGIALLCFTIEFTNRLLLEQIRLKQLELDHAQQNEPCK